MTEASLSTYDLLEIQHLFRLRQYQLSSEVFRTLGRDGFDEEDVWDCVMSLTPADFHKTMPSDRNPSEMLDVYRPAYGQRRVYVKLKIVKHGDLVYVLSFKEDSSR